MTNLTIEPTRNTEWGFFGTVTREGQNAALAWNLASAAIKSAVDASPEAVRDFLDSRHGRHFADSVLDTFQHGITLQQAIAEATSQWLRWTISRQTERDLGIPRGLPYLTGFVIHFEIQLEIEAAA